MITLPYTKRLAVWPVVVAALALNASLGGAQNLDMPRLVIAGGGGTSSALSLGGAGTGGGLSLSGTIGQPAAGGPLTGGAFSLTGGFWALPVPVQMPGAPVLSVSFSNGLVKVSWPLGTNAFQLESTTALAANPASTVWTTVPPPYQSNATHVFITTPPAGAAAYYRLRFP